MLLTAVIFILILSILVLIHELGHFLVAKKFGIKVEEFGFGLPPRVLSKKFGETVYSLNLLPIGGFVRLLGEESEESIDKKVDPGIINKRAFFSRPIWQRVLVLTAGVTMNFLLAVTIISYLFTQGVMVPTQRVHLDKILEESPASLAGLQAQDIVKKIQFLNSNSQIEEVEIKKGEQLINTVKDHLGEEIVLVVDRNGVISDFRLVPRKEYPKDQGPMGVIISNFEERKYTVWQAPIYGMKEAFVMSFELAKGIGQTVWKLITFQQISKDVAGPLGIAQMTGEAVKFGARAILELLGLLSLNLAILNILPFPALDGGRLLFVLIEGFTGKRIKITWERYIHQTGMVLLLALVVVVTVNDFLRIFGK